jgi:LAO/AO transport system kinase
MNPNSASDLLSTMESGDKRALARCITIVENDLPGYRELLRSLKFRKTVPVIGITGPPGAGKSTLISMLLKNLTAQGKSVGVVAVDPTSPFTQGSLLGDRLRMSEHFVNENVFIRSLATRGSLGGLSAKSIEITDVMRAFGFDMIILETVGVGQSEVEIVGLADLTILVLVPEAGDEVQTLKSGVMEIADIYVVNKSDRDGADLFVKNLISLVQSRHEFNTPIIKAVATRSEGISEINAAIEKLWSSHRNEKQTWLLTEKAYRLIGQQRMKNISRDLLKTGIQEAQKKAGFNLYDYVETFLP